MTDDPGRAERARLSGGRLLAKNSGAYLIGQAVVLTIAFVSVPLLIDGLGTARFGLLSIVWVIIGYAGILDLGLGRALTAIASDRIGSGREAEVPPLFWTAFGLMLAAGLLGAAVLAAVSPWLVESVIQVPEGLRDETVATVYLMSASIPFTIATLASKAILATYQHGWVINTIQTPVSALSYGGPVLMLGFSDTLTAVVAVVVASRVAGFIAISIFALRLVPALRHRVAVGRSAASQLARFGGWVTLSNVVQPVMQQFDRVLVGVLLSASAVAFYAAPAEAVKRLFVISFAITSVLYPAFSLTRRKDPDRAVKLFGVGNRAIFAALFPVVLIVVTFASELLDLWLGANFARSSEHVFQWLAAGVFITGLCEVAYSFVLSSRPDLMTKSELVELPLFLAYFWLLTNAMGIEGAAIAWTIRQVTGAFMAYGLAYYLSSLTLPTTRRIGIAMAMALAILFAASQLDALAAKFVFAAFTIPCFVVLAWTKLADPEDHQWLRQRWRDAYSDFRRTQQA